MDIASLHPVDNQVVFRSKLENRRDWPVLRLLLCQNTVQLRDAELG